MVHLSAGLALLVLAGCDPGFYAPVGDHETTAVDAAAGPGPLADAAVGGGDQAGPGTVDGSAREGGPMDLGPVSCPSPSVDFGAVNVCANVNNPDAVYGAYCGTAQNGGDPATLYFCLGKQIHEAARCEFGCHIAPNGVRDYCELALPVACNTPFYCTQGNSGDICGTNGGDHVGLEQYAWDFGGLGRGKTAIVAARSGTVAALAPDAPPGKKYASASTGEQYECFNGCGSLTGAQTFSDCCSTCVLHSNHLKVDHHDGTATVYVHLESIAPGLVVCQPVKAGDLLGYGGTSGCSTGPHLHFMSMTTVAPAAHAADYCTTGSPNECQSLVSSFVAVGVPACGQNLTSTTACH